MKRYIKATALNPLDSSVEEQLDICMDPDANSEVLTELANSPYVEVLQYVAMHPNTPVSVKISINPVVLMDATERGYIAGSLSTPVDVLELLATDPCSPVQFEVAENPNTPAEVRQEIVDFYSDVCTLIVFAMSIVEDRQFIIDSIKGVVGNLILTDNVSLRLFDCYINDDGGSDRLAIRTQWLPLLDDKKAIANAVISQLEILGYQVFDWVWEDV